MVFGVTTSLVIDKKESYIKPKETPKEFKIKIEGAVLNKGEYIAKKGDKLFDVIKQAQPLSNANLKEIDIGLSINKNMSIFIEYDIEKGPFLDWKLLNKSTQLSRYGIKKSIASKLLKYRKTNNKTTWTKLGQLKGIGPETLKKLRKILIL
ncbi:hypothetical protein NXS15_01915 [Mycoplasma sp. CSL7475-4]|uniref:MAG0490 family ComEA-like DNA-binding protein n=1 Tax=Mycoplasma sp. CSL7475-4 TaxID=2973942 RepID=UPI00216B0311|nr:hypothetical protein [Mycoplasma sp. CSL7475-4]MCS4536875.1 hypothetical protein [Mycoplasma sp. CSL7475-4]